MNKHIFALALLLLLTTLSMQAQDDGKQIVVTGSIQSDILIPQDDKHIGTEETSDWAQTNTYAEVNARSKYVDAGARLEYLAHPLPGFESDYKGWGVPYFYVKGKFKHVELTAGCLYEQFGSGFILRTYEERSLGIDNALIGGRLVFRPTKGVTVKALGGKQRRYWDINKAWITGADAEWSIDQWVKGMADRRIYLTLGLSWVNKHEETEDLMTDATHKLNLPTNVNALDIRANLQASDFHIMAEYATKTQDPSFDNGYIYRRGTVVMLSSSYSKRGFSLLLQAKRSENMSFRSRRSANGTSSFINHLPAFTMEHTYALAALYPYATHPNGEWAYQAELGYSFKKGTTLGGKYGTKVKLNYAYINGIDRHTKNGGGMGTDGYGSAFWKWGDGMYYQDLNVQVDKKISRRFKLNFMLMNQFYNKTIVEGEGGMVHSNIVVAEGKYRLNKRFTLRNEVQYLHTDDDQRDWLFGLIELSAHPHWMFSLSDLYNSGETHLHYYQGYVTFNTGAHRLQLGYGRTRAGYNCAGGVCRYVPASKGFTLSYNYNF